MSNRKFIADLSSTEANIRKLDAKKINLKGKNILEYIEENKTTVLDERGTNITPYDLWGTRAETAEDGTVTIFHESIDASVNKYADEKNGWNFPYGLYERNRWMIGVELPPWFTDLCLLDFSTREDYKWSLIDNKLYKDGEFVANIQTNMIEKGEGMFGGETDVYRARLFEFNSDLSNLTDGTYMFDYCSYLESFNVDLSSLTNGEGMFFGCHNLTSFASDLSSLTNGYAMFDCCHNLTSFASDSSGSPVNLSSLTNGNSMFEYCSLTSFSSNLSSLTNGHWMFNYCTNLETFTSELPSLTDGYGMFMDCTRLKSFSSDMPNLTDGEEMFRDCSSLESFSSDLSSLTNGNTMFYNCPNLTSFSSDLSSLTDGENMFKSCKLNPKSVANIIHFIPQRDAKPTNTWDEGNIYIGINITNTDAEKQLFAEECECDTWEELNKEFDDKNWAVQWQFNGEATTYGLRDPRPSTAIYAKLEEVFLPTEEEIAAAKTKRERIRIPHYEYTSQDDSKFYNIHWYHESNTNNEGYDYFESLEVATLTYGVIPKE